MVLDLSSSYSGIAAHEKLAKELDKYYLPTRYPDALPGGVPFEVYDDPDDAAEAVDGAQAVLVIVGDTIEA